MGGGVLLAVPQRKLLGGREKEGSQHPGHSQCQLGEAAGTFSTNTSSLLVTHPPPTPSQRIRQDAS